MRRVAAISIVVFTLLGNWAMASQNLELYGKGLAKYMGLVDVYEAALYTERVGKIHNILDVEFSKCLRLDYKLSLNPKDFIQGADSVLQRQHEPEALQRVEREITALHNAYRPVKQGDQYQLCYDGEKKVTTLLLNREELIAIESAEFGSIYLGIWLGPREPIDRRLRDSLLKGRN